MNRSQRGRLRPWHIGVLCALPYLAFFFYLLYRDLKTPGTDAMIFAGYAGWPLTLLVGPIALLVGFDTPWNVPVQWVGCGVLGALNWGLIGTWVAREKYFPPRSMNAAEGSAKQEKDRTLPDA